MTTILPTVPAAEAPEGVWCIVKQRPATEEDMPYPDWREHYERFSSHEDAKQAVKISGRWWVWSSDGTHLRKWSGSRGEMVWRHSGGFGVQMPYRIWAHEPDFATPIPPDVLARSAR